MSDPTTSVTSLRSRLAAKLPPKGAARILTVNALIGSTGTGLFLTGSALFYTRVVGVSTSQLAIGLGAAGACGLLATVPAGTLADRLGPRRVLMTMHAFRAIAYTLVAFVQGFWPFLIAVCAITAAERSGPPANQAMVAGLFTKEQRVKRLALVHASRNVGLSFGAALAGIAVSVGSPTAFRVLVLANAATFVVATAMVWHLRKYESAQQETTTPAAGLPEPPAEDPAATTATPAAPDAEVDPAAPTISFLPVRSPALLALAAVMGALMLHDSILFIALPLWIVSQTEAPAVMVGVTLVLNTAITAIIQVRLTDLTDTYRKAVRIFVPAGIGLLIACSVMALSTLPGIVAGVTFLVVGIIVLTVAENLHMASAWQIHYDLAPPDARARYLSIFLLGEGAQDIYGPLVVTALIIGLGTSGWLIMGGLFVVASLATIVLSRYCGRATGLLSARPPAVTSVHD